MTSQAAPAIRDALLDVAASSPAHRRLYLREHLGVAPAEIFRELEALLDTRIEVGPPGHSRQLGGIVRGSSLLIPYLVDEDGPYTQNRGLQGYAGALRTDFAQLATGERKHVLLILDREPFETVLTAAEDAATLQPLSWQGLIARISRRASGPGAPTVQAVADDLQVLRPGQRSRDLLERFAAFAGGAWESEEHAGLALTRLGRYVADRAPAPHRLRQSAEWRANLERWSMPDRDLARELTRIAGESTPGIARVLAAYGVGGLDYSRFTLNDLPERTSRRSAGIALPPQILGAISSVATSSAACCWLPEGSDTLAIRISGEITSFKPSIQWRRGNSEACHVDEAAMLVNVRVPDQPGWQFGTLAAGGRHLLRLAIYRGGGEWFPVEANLDIDVEAGCFSAPDPPQGLAVGMLGTVLGEAALEVPDVDPGMRVDARATYLGSGASLPVLIHVAGAEPGSSAPGEGGDPGEGDPMLGGRERYPGGEDPEDGDPAGGEEGSGPGTSAGSAESAAHALLAVAAARSRDGAAAPPGPATFARAPEPVFSIGGALCGLESQQLLPGVDGLELEGRILAQPAALAYTLVRESGGVRLIPDPSLERFSLDGLDGGHVASFLDTRDALFRSIEGEGTVHAIMCGHAADEAAAYVDAYGQLLAGLEIPGRYVPELDRVLLSDLVRDPETGQCWLAPTNPVTVAWSLQAAQHSLGWAASGSALAARDLRSLSPRNLLPLLHSGGAWWEADTRSPLLWRRYRALGSSLALGGGDHRTITRRLSRFLAVFPAYQDPRQRLAVALHEPGDGGSAAEALRAFYKPELAPGADHTRPALDLTVHNEDGAVPQQLATLIAPDNDSTLDNLVRSRIRLSCVPGTERPRFAHLSFLFRSPAAREPRPLALGDRSPTDWVDGLAAAPGRVASFGANEMVFASGLFVGDAPGPLSRMVKRCLELVGGQPRGMLQPEITNAITTAVESGPLDDVYSSSVWVVHADRLLGLEAFSPERGRDLTIVDFDDEGSAWQAGLDSITVTERVEPYRAALTRALAPAAALARESLPGLIQAGNAVSGRWNLELLSLPINRVRERIGILAAVAALRDLDRAFEPGGERQDLGGVLLPLDELFRLLPASGLKRPQTRSCDDLLYLRLREVPGGLRLAARLIEVKFSSTGQPDLGIARRELEATREWLDAAFNNRTASRPFRSRDLAELLRNGAIRNRSFRLGSLEPSHVEHAAAVISRGSYTLDLTYRVGDDPVHGDVISLELENPVPASRQRLPGEGALMGYVRLGLPALQRLARGEPLAVPAAWPTVSYLGEGPEGPDPAREGEGQPPGTPPAAGPAGLPPSASGPGDRAARGDRAAPASDAGPGANPAPAAGEEVGSKAIELDVAAAKYGLQLAPFDPALAQVGPSVIRFRTKLLGKQTISAVRNRALDLGREVGTAEGVLVDQEPYYLTVDVPRANRVLVPLSEHLSALDAPRAPGALPFLLGMAPSGEVRVEDLARLPHLLVAGATGSGKSVLLRGILCCLARVRSPMQLQILIIDPKQVDFLPFDDLLHLAGGRILTDPVEAVEALESTLAREVAWRRGKLKEAGATSALEFYEMGGAVEELPQMVVLVDEFADLAASLGRQDQAAFMTLIQRYGQLTRAFGIYLVLATQRPSVKVITGDIKANLTARVALRLQSADDSRTILGRGGAETLRDRGDLIFDHGGRSERLQGFYAALQDIREVKARWEAPPRA